MDKTNNKPIVCNAENILYVYNGEVEDGKFSFTNLKTGVTGLLSKEQSSKLLKVPLEINEMVLPYPNIIELFRVFSGNVIVEKNNLKKQYFV